MYLFLPHEKEKENKMKIFLNGILILLSLHQNLLANTNQKENIQETVKIQPFNYKSFSRIPILHLGRVKPLSTFAREYLITLYGKASLPQASAESWLAETLFNPEQSYKRSIFKIWNPEVSSILNLNKKKSPLYSFNELAPAFDQQLKELNILKNQKKRENRTLVETQLLELYGRVQAYFALSRSLTLILPFFSIKSPEVAQKIGLKINQKYSYLNLLNFQQKIQKKVNKIVQKNPRKNLKKLAEKDMNLLLVSYKMQLISKDEGNDLFRIIPPQWKDNQELWHSPWSLMKLGRGTPSSAKYLNTWIEMEQAYRMQVGMKKATEKSWKQVLTMAHSFVSPLFLKMETIFNDFQFFQKSLGFYLLGFFLFFLSYIFWKKWLLKICFISILLGLLCHLTGIVFRVIILSRPPVATLYESIIFVGFVVVTCCLVVKKIRPLSLLIASLAGSALHLIAFKYQGADSMELLVPVLNTNFWLASHVICITIGYAFSLLLSLMGHIYIFLKCFSKNRDKKKLNALFKNMIGMSFLALFFCLFGTILGGIWADQSWGRFWGWDPKENGALFIVLWLLVLFHGKLAGILQQDTWALAHVLTNVTLALSWFGVNLLNTGLHSYGFIDGVAWGLAGFCGGEVLFFLSMLVKLKYNEISKVFINDKI